MLCRVLRTSQRNFRRSLSTTPDRNANGKDDMNGKDDKKSDVAERSSAEIAEQKRREDWINTKEERLQVLEVEHERRELMKTTPNRIMLYHNKLQLAIRQRDERPAIYALEEPIPPGLYRSVYRDIIKKEWAEPTNIMPIITPRRSEILIIGAGAIGLSCAYSIMRLLNHEQEVTVVERDYTYSKASSVLSVGGIRQQFSLPENIRLSLQTSWFMRNIREYLTIEGLDPPDVQFTPQGYLFLSSEAGERTMLDNHATQTAEGAAVALLKKDELKEKWPWLNTEGITLGSYGLENEGWIDPWQYMAALKAKAASMGVTFIKGEVIGFSFNPARIDAPDMERHGLRKRSQNMGATMIREDETGKVINCESGRIINAAGAWAGEVAKMAGIGREKSGVLSIPLPIERRKRFVYVVHCPHGPGLEMPFLIDPSGVYVRREGLGGHYICGCSPGQDEEPDIDNLDVDYDYFYEKIWPLLAHRIPAFEELKEPEPVPADSEGVTPDYMEQELMREYFYRTVLPRLEHRIPSFINAQVTSAWAGYYDYNYFDQNLIFGEHPRYRSMLFVAGCSGHGLQHSAAIGQEVANWVVKGKFGNIDLSRLSFERVLTKSPLFERGII